MESKLRRGEQIKMVFSRLWHSENLSFSLTVAPHVRRPVQHALDADSREELCWWAERKYVEFI